VRRPLFELISRVAAQVYNDDDSANMPVYEGEAAVAAWRLERKRVVSAILKQDPELARFEAERHRQSFLTRMMRIEHPAATASTA
jgi:GntR family transcriptional regulator, transcriptional repressor for pyruvate dehydrogenase complex